MESLEFLLETGFKPKRSFIIAMGHDEEASGLDGAREMSKIIKSRLHGKQLLYLLDEGTYVLKEGTFPGVPHSVAL